MAISCFGPNGQVYPTVTESPLSSFTDSAGGGNGRLRTQSPHHCHPFRGAALPGRRQRRPGGRRQNHRPERGRRGAAAPQRRQTAARGTTDSELT